MAAPPERVWAALVAPEALIAVAPSWRDDWQVRAIRCPAGRDVPDGTDLFRRVWSTGQGQCGFRHRRDRLRRYRPGRAGSLQAVDFVSDDPAYAGTTTMTREVTACRWGDAPSRHRPRGRSGRHLHRGPPPWGSPSSLTNLAATWSISLALPWPMAEARRHREQGRWVEVSVVAYRRGGHADVQSRCLAGAGREANQELEPGTPAGEAKAPSQTPLRPGGPERPVDLWPSSRRARPLRRCDMRRAVRG